MSNSCQHFSRLYVRICSFITIHVNLIYIDLKMKPASWSGDQQGDTSVSQEDPSLCTCRIGTHYELLLSEGFPGETSDIKLLLCDMYT